MDNFRRNNRSNDRGGRGGRGFGGDRERAEMHRATCDECGKNCEVPFRPTNGKPVYCSDCFSQQHGGAEPRRKSFDRNDRGDSRRSFGSEDRQMHKAVCAECHQECEVPFRPTNDKPVYCNKCFGKGDNVRGSKSSSGPSSKELDSINSKLDLILKLLSGKGEKKVKSEKVEVAEVEKVVEKAAKKVKKETKKAKAEPKKKKATAKKKK